LLSWDAIKGSSLLVTGGTGSFGRAFVQRILAAPVDVSRIVIYSRDELKQWDMQQLYPPDKYPQVRFFIGDIRDRKRFSRALEGIDTVIHAAALKQVPCAEYNPMEFIKTNVLGAENVVEACLDSDVHSVVALSTDKAAAPINLYGASKLCSDKLFIAANNVKGSRNLRFSVVRYGNVMGSRGSVIPFFLNQVKSGALPITDPRMTRFNISLDDGVNMVLWAINNAFGGEIFIPKIPSYRITDVAEAIGPSCSKPEIGIRSGEKLHEEMITSADSLNTIDLGDYYAILSPANSCMKKYESSFPDLQYVPPGFSYVSNTNPHFLTVQQIRELIKDHIDSEFQPI